MTASSNNQAGGRHVIDLWDFCEFSPKKSQKMFFMVFGVFYSLTFILFFPFLNASVFLVFAFPNICEVVEPH